jgi:hypothetical protein
LIEPIDAVTFSTTRIFTGSKNVETSPEASAPVNPPFADNEPRLRGVIIDFNQTRKIGRIAGSDYKYYFFTEFSFLTGSPFIGAFVDFIVPDKIVAGGLLPKACYIRIQQATEAGQAALASPAGPTESTAGVE